MINLKHLVVLRKLKFVLQIKKLQPKRRSKHTLIHNRKHIRMLNRRTHINDRQKIMSIITTDVHSRDVINHFIKDKIETNDSFEWQSQLRHLWNDEEENCYINCCDGIFNYSYEPLSHILFSC